MKNKILKYNLIPMLIFFILSMLYTIGAFLNGLMMEIKFRSGDYAYKSIGMNGKLFEELYGTEESLGYIFGSFFALFCITVITILFYRKILSKISVILFSLSILPAFSIFVRLMSENLFLVAEILIIETVYMFLTVFFVCKDYKKIQIEKNEITV